MNPLSIVYIASIEIITSPPGCKLFYCAEMPQYFRRWVATVFFNILSCRMRLQASLDSASIILMSLSVKFIFLLELLPVQNVVIYLTFEEELPIRQGIRFHFYA